MKERISLLVSSLLVATMASHAGSLGQKVDNDKQSSQERPIRLRTEEVLVDAIVTDKKNKPIENLTADDFEVLEDGVKQKLSSFRYESNGLKRETGVSTETARPSADSKRPNMVSIVLDAETTRDGALLARRAAVDFVETEMAPNDYVAVFGIDQNLLVLAPFTQDKAVLKRAIEAFTSRESKKYTAVAGEVRQALEGLVTPLSDAEKLNIADTMTTFDAIPPEEPPPAPAGSRSAAPNQVDPARVTRTQILLSALKTLRTFSVYETQFQALRVVDALLAIISGQSSLRAGRKTLMFFSEGVAIPATASDQFLSVISAANKAGVTIYALDIAGLRVINPNEETMLERDAAAAKRIRNYNPELVSDGTSALGKMENTARMNYVATLDELSEQTGGYTVKNTNDLVDGLKKIAEGLSSYYVMTYRSTNENYDGKFRRIAVKLKNPEGLRLRARQGYFGLLSLDNSPVMSAELPLLDRANSTSPQQEFPLYAEALHFRGTAGTRQIALYLQFPMSALTFNTDDKTRTFSSRFAVLLLVRNETGMIVRKLGQEFSLHGPIAQLDQASKNPQIYSRLIPLEPGRYKLDGVARDSISGKASVVHDEFEVPTLVEGGVGISSVVLSRGVNPLTEQQKKEAAHPLYLEGQAYFVPNVTQSFSAGSDKNLLVHFDVYAPKADGGRVSVSINFYKGGSLIAQSSGALPEPDAAGRISYSTSFGLEAFSAGEYQLVITASAGSGRASSRTRFEIQP
jgi:VWFA-related protein